MEMVKNTRVNTIEFPRYFAKQNTACKMEPITSRSGSINTRLILLNAAGRG